MKKIYSIKYIEPKIDPELLRQNLLYGNLKREITVAAIRDREREKLSQNDGLLNGNKNHNP